ncbi:SGNH hydrolase-type esterase domain-containing protein [Stachybotrys elegans]|uniref:SGNH hydrolase-type esterase domain-containing protein n=1 Tax=Stachybotrys elegans TaxID=80388 RepID=A0A8K0SNE3_9HYPO|nr:SGNH hydrolase-type esterase domain-containing protein [Stachybotrys elegans]
MTRLLRIVGQVAALSLAVVANAQDIPLRLMPLGASITNGVGSSTGNGYRQFLLDRLNGAGYTVDYVGSQQSGDMADPDNEGFPGLRIEEVQQRAEEDVPNYLPNVYAINVGTNDATQDFDIDNAGGRMDDLLDYLWEVTPNATVLLSTLIINLNADTEARAQVINAQFVELAEQLAGEGRRIVLVDMHTEEGPLPEDMSDATHPNDTGFDKMAELWFRGVEQASAAGFIQPAL